MPGRPPRPSGSSSIPALRTRSAKSTKAPPSWTGWSRSRSAASPSRPPRRPASGATTASTSSTRRATSTSPSKSSARCACSTARCGVRRRLRRRAAVGNRVAPGRQVPRAAHLLRQQDGPHRRGLQGDAVADRQQARRQSRRDSAADWRRRQVQGRGRPGPHEGARLQGRDHGRRLRRRRTFRPTCWKTPRPTTKSWSRRSASRTTSSSKSISAAKRSPKTN